MLLTVDIGNTNITLGVYDGEQLVFTSRMLTDSRRLCDQYAIEVSDILTLYGVQREQITGSIICSVVPPLTAAFEQAMIRLFGVKPLVIGPGLKTGLDIKIDNPAQLGADVVAGAVGAIGMGCFPAVIFDLGTATTMFVLDREGKMLGGAIMPGVQVSLDALITRTAQLQQISLEQPKTVMGKNTIESLRSGSVYGTAAMMDGMCDRVEAELGYAVKTAATGGLSGVIIPHCKRNMEPMDHLVMQGLHSLYYKNT